MGGRSPSKQPSLMGGPSKQPSLMMIGRVTGLKAELDRLCWSLKKYA